jgi:hypothetical protein
MKKITILAFLFITILSANAQVSAPAQVSNPVGTALPVPADVLQLKENNHNFGKIPQGRPAVYIFQIVNTGDTPLRLDNVRASCGCTTPEWSKAPIEPGATAEIKVGYNAFAEGAFTKTVTILYSGTRSKTLTISGEVYKVPASSAPDNASVQLLKQIN